MGKFLTDTSHKIHPLISSLAVILGAVGLFAALVIVSSLLRSKITNQRLMLVSRVFGAIIGVYGIVTLYKGMALV